MDHKLSACTDSDIGGYDERAEVHGSGPHCAHRMEGQRLPRDVGCSGEAAAAVASSCATPLRSSRGAPTCVSAASKRVRLLSRTSNAPHPGSILSTSTVACRTPSTQITQFRSMSRMCTHLLCQGFMVFDALQSHLQDFSVSQRLLRHRCATRADDVQVSLQE